MKFSTVFKVFFFFCATLAINFCLAGQRQNCFQILDPVVTTGDIDLVEIHVAEADPDPVMTSLDQLGPVEIRFSSLAVLIDFQNKNQKFMQKLYDQSGSFVFPLNEINRNKFLTEIDRLRQLSMRAAIEIRQFNNLYLQTFIPTSMFSINSRQRFTPEETEQRLDRQRYMVFNEDGSVSLHNSGYRRFISRRLVDVITPGSRLRVFRGMQKHHSRFMIFASHYAKGQLCPICRKDLIDALANEMEGINEASSDEEVLRKAHSLTFQKSGYIFTTPDPRWAANWGGVYEMLIDMHSLPESVLNKIYVATDGAHNLGGGVIEIDFPVFNFELAMAFFAHVEMRSAGPINRTLANRVDPNGNEIPRHLDVHEVPLAPIE